MAAHQRTGASASDGEAGQCPATCFGLLEEGARAENCDAWAGYSCATLTESGCDCTGCACSGGAQGGADDDPLGAAGTGDEALDPGGRRRCFTQQDDFLPNALLGEWKGVDWSEEAANANLDAGRRRLYGDLTCPFEEESKSCGRTVGTWSAIVESRPAAAAANAAFARGHMELVPDRCELAE